MTRKLLESQSNPCVIVPVIHDNERPTLLQLVIKNIGMGLAQDITFDFSRPLPARAFGLTDKEAKKAELMKNGPIIDGIPALGPGETRRIDWRQYGGLLKNFGTEPAIVTCKFKKNGKTMPPMECKIDIKSFEGTMAARSSEAIVAKELESISKDLHNIVTGFSRLKINIVEDEVFGLLKEKDEA